MPKLTVEFTDRVNNMLDELAQREGRTKIEILRRAIGMYKYLGDTVRDETSSGRSVAVVDKDKHVLTEIAWLE